jgi:DNA-binding response OmpR family regulator
MNVLIAEDDMVSRKLLDASLRKWGHDTVLCGDGAEAEKVLLSPEPPRIAVLDWMMPGRDGLELCRLIRSTEQLKTMYVVLLTAKGSKEDVVEGLDAGADDYVTKPFDRAELRARINTGVRIAAAEEALQQRVNELEQAMAQIKTLKGLLPLCAWCRKVRDDDGYWKQIELYVSEH